MFDCEGESLVGILSGAGLPAGRGVLIVVGGPQYGWKSPAVRVAGPPSRGTRCANCGSTIAEMGDSDVRCGRSNEWSEDIRCAIDRSSRAYPGLKDVVIWGLCDAASAALFYAHQDAAGERADTAHPLGAPQPRALRAHTSRHYYLQRLFQGSLWRKGGTRRVQFSRGSGALGRLSLMQWGVVARRALSMIRPRAGRRSRTGWKTDCAVHAGSCSS